MRESFFVDIREKAADTGNVCTKSVCLKGRAKRDEGGDNGRIWRRERSAKAPLPPWQQDVALRK